MDKLTAIKIKYEDGHYSEEIPVSALAENVEWDDTHTLVDVLGNVNINTQGSVQDQLTQLFNSKVTTSEMQTYVSGNMKTEVAAWLTAHVNPVGSVVTLDNTLTIKGSAADAAAVGQKILQPRVALETTWEMTGHIEYNGDNSPNTVYAHCNYIDVSQYDIVSFELTMTHQDAYSAFYDENKVFIASYPIDLPVGTSYYLVVPKNAKYFRTTERVSYIQGHEDEHIIYGIGKKKIFFPPTITQEYAEANYLDLYNYVIKDFGKMLKKSPSPLSNAFDWITTDYLPFDGFPPIYLSFSKMHDYLWATESQGFYFQVYNEAKNSLGYTAISHNTQSAADIFNLNKRTFYDVREFFRILSPGLHFENIKYIRFSFNTNYIIKVYAPHLEQNYRNILATQDIMTHINLIDSNDLIPNTYIVNNNASNIFNKFIAAQKPISEEEKIRLCTNKAPKNTAGVWTTNLHAIKIPPKYYLYLKSQPNEVLFCIIFHGWKIYNTKQFVIKSGEIKDSSINIKMDEEGKAIIYNNTNKVLQFYYSILGTYYQFNSRFKCYLTTELDRNKQTPLEIYPESQSREIWYNILHNADVSNLVNYDKDKFITWNLIYPTAIALSKLYYTSGTDKKITIAFGLHDQRDWFVPSYQFTLNVKKGKNVIDLTHQHYVIPANQQIAISVDKNDQYYKHGNYGNEDSNLNYDCDYENTPNRFEEFESLAANEITTLPKNFAPLWTFDWVPVFDEVATKSNQTAYTNLFNSTIISNTSGELFRLQLNNQGEFIKSRVIPKNYLAIGNSITYHGYMQNVNWLCHDNRGMAATYKKYDYVRRLQKYFKEHRTDPDTYENFHFSQWQHQTDRDSILSTLDQELRKKQWDLISIQLSENVGNTATLQKDYISLIKHIQQKVPGALVIMIGDCFNSATKDNMKKVACKTTHIPFIDLSAYSIASNFKSAMGTTIHSDDGSLFTVTNSGVAGHPGDHGMKIIAQEVLKVILNDPSIQLPETFE